MRIQPRDAAAFEELFDRYWSGSAGGQRVFAPRPASPLGQTAGRRSAGASREGGEEPAAPEGRSPAYSAEAVLKRKSFEECSTADLAAMEKLLTRLAARLSTRKSRRLVPVRGRGQVDLRRSFRGALATDAELLRLARRARAVEEPRIVALCDTSGSMDSHTRFLLAFLLALKKVARGTEIFVFNTALTRLTPWLLPGKVGPTLERLAAGVPDWSGGTRIGECLSTFADNYLGHLVGSTTVVLILSDGLDRGETAAIARAMRSIRSKARRVVWLNPLLADSRYEPTQRGMEAALPFVDVLAPAHNLESLERLIPMLAA